MTLFVPPSPPTTENHCAWPDSEFLILIRSVEKKADRRLLGAIWVKSDHPIRSRIFRNATCSTLKPHVDLLKWPARDVTEKLNNVYDDFKPTLHDVWHFQSFISCIFFYFQQNYKGVIFSSTLLFLAYFRNQTNQRKIIRHIHKQRIIIL